MMMKMQRDERTVINHARQILLNEQNEQRLSEDDDSGSELFVKMGVDEDTPMTEGNVDQPYQQVQQHVVATRSDPRQNIGARANRSTTYQ